VRATRSWLPPGVAPDAARLVAARGARGMADGLASLVLPAYLTALGHGPFEIGALVTAALLGSAALTLAVGLVGDRVPARAVLLAACALMAATGAGFVGFEAFAPLLVVAFVGTLNPSSGDVSVFLPTEQALLAESSPPEARTALFARYNVAGGLGGALGALAAGLPGALAAAFGGEALDGHRLAFGAYAAAAGVQVALYRPLAVGRRAAGPRASGPRRAPLASSRRIVLGLAALFSLDSFGGGFAVQSLLALWLFQRFGLSLEAAGVVFFAANLLSALSQLASPWLAARIGLVRTMVFTHLPANAFLVLAAFMPDAPSAVACLCLRMAFSQMDVPARQSLVMALVPPEERAAAASVTNVPRSLATALAPSLAGAMLAASSFGWPLVCGGILKIAYDLALFTLYRAREPAPPAEPGSRARP
jgi:MFS family permease